MKKAVKVNKIALGASAVLSIDWVIICVKYALKVPNTELERLVLAISLIVLLLCTAFLLDEDE